MILIESTDITGASSHTTDYFTDEFYAYKIILTNFDNGTTSAANFTFYLRHYSPVTDPESYQRIISSYSSNTVTEVGQNVANLRDVRVDGSTATYANHTGSPYRPNPQMDILEWVFTRNPTMSSGWNGECVHLNENGDTQFVQAQGRLPDYKTDGQFRGWSRLFLSWTGTATRGRLALYGYPVT